MSKLLEKTFRFNVNITKSSGDLKGKDFFVEGYASTSDLDRQGDIIVRATLKDAADKLVNLNNTVFYGHEYDLANSVGLILEAEVDDIGLKVKIYVSEWAKELRTKLKEGIINKFSIGGRVIKDRKIPKSQALVQGIIEEDVPFEEITIIEKMELFEVSFVGVPANPQAQVVETLTKALEKLYKGGVGMKETKKEEVKIEEEETSEIVEETVEKDDNIVEEPKEEKETSEVIETPVEETAEPTEEKTEPVEEPKEEETVEETVESTEEKTETVEEKVETPEEVTEETVKELVEEEETKEETKELEKAYDEAFIQEVKDALKANADAIKAIAEDIATLKTLVNTETFEELKSFIVDKIKTIEITAEKKSLVKKVKTEKKKEAPKKKGADEAFLDFMKGNKEEI